MPSIDSKLNALRRKAAKNDLEVEHLTAFAVLGDARAAAVIRELQAKHAWPRSNRAANGPLARWAEVVCAYLEGGCDALVNYARRPESDSLYFAVAVLQEVKSAACVLALAKLSEDTVKALPKGVKDGLSLADAINLTLSFKNPPRVQSQTSKCLRSFLHALVRQKLGEPERARVVCALRGVGNEESIRLINQLPAFSGPWAGVESLACKAIRKRLRDA